MQSREEEGWRKSAPVEDRANYSEKTGVEVGSGACIDGSIKKKKKKSFGFSSQTKCFKMSPDLKSRKVF